MTTQTKSDPLAIPHIVEKIYITKGGAGKDIDGALLFKYVGIVINDKIHWLKEHCSNIYELTYLFNRLNIQVKPTSWFYKDSDPTTPNKRITKIGREYAVFDVKSSYWKRTKLNPNGMTFWTIEDIEATYLTNSH